MTEPKVYAKAGPFELVKDCYQPKCDRLATREHGGYPVCDQCSSLMSRLEEAWDLHYQIQIYETDLRSAEVNRRMVAKYGEDWRKSL